MASINLIFYSTTISISNHILKNNSIFILNIHFQLMNLLKHSKVHLILGVSAVGNKHTLPNQLAIQQIIDNVQYHQIK